MPAFYYCNVFVTLILKNWNKSLTQHNASDSTSSQLVTKNYFARTPNYFVKLK